MMTAYGLAQFFKDLASKMKSNEYFLLCLNPDGQGFAIIADKETNVIYDGHKWTDVEDSGDALTDLKPHLTISDPKFTDAELRDIMSDENGQAVKPV